MLGYGRDLAGLVWFSEEPGRESLQVIVVVALIRLDKPSSGLGRNILEHIGKNAALR